MIVNLLVVMAFLPLMILMLTWITAAGGASSLLYPIVLGNAFNVPWWVVGFVALIPGTMAAYSSKYETIIFRSICFSHGKRVLFMNVWVISLSLFTLLYVETFEYLFLLEHLLLVALGCTESMQTVNS
jgi:hypothetical protein